MDSALAAIRRAIAVSTASWLARATLFCAVALVGTVAGLSGGSPHPVSAAVLVGDCTPDASWPAENPGLESQVLSLINQHRASLGLGQLSVSPKLTASAVWKSRHMAEYRYFGHDDPAPPVARTAFDRIAACGYTASAGENIAEGFTTAQSVVDAWLASAGHRTNIENPAYVATGVGVATTSDGIVLWTQDFGTVADGGSPPAPPAPTPPAPTPPAPTPPAPTPPSTTTTPPPATTTTTAPKTPTGTSAKTSTGAISLHGFTVAVGTRRLVLASQVQRSRSAGGAPSVKCTATVAGKSLRVVVNAFRSEQARCAWRLPKRMPAGAVAHGTIRVKQGSLHARQAFAIPVG